MTLPAHASPCPYEGLGQGWLTARLLLGSAEASCVEGLATGSPGPARGL